CALRGPPFPVWIKRGRRVNRLKAVSSAMSFFCKDTTILATMQVLYEQNLFPQLLSYLWLYQECLQHCSANCQRLIRNKETGTRIIPRIYIPNFQPLGYLNAITD